VIPDGFEAAQLEQLLARHVRARELREQVVAHWKAGHRCEVPALGIGVVPIARRPLVRGGQRVGPIEGELQVEGPRRIDPGEVLDGLVRQLVDDVPVVDPVAAAILDELVVPEVGRVAVGQGDPVLEPEARRRRVADVPLADQRGLIAAVGERERQRPVLGDGAPARFLVGHPRIGQRVVQPVLARQQAGEQRRARR
jgi:hypothetical protein